MTVITGSTSVKPEREWNIGWADVGPFVALIALLAIGFAVNPDFLSATNLGNVITRSAFIAIIAVGATIGGIEADFIVARYLCDGGLDHSFGDDKGWLRTRLGRSLDTANSLALQADDAILVGGYSLDGNYRAMVARYLNH